MDFSFGDFDDDLFENKVKKNVENLNEVIKNYIPKQVTSKKFFDDKPSDIEESANLIKMKGDYHYYKEKFSDAIGFYQKSLEISYESKSLNDTIFQKELNESIARCFQRMNKFREGLEVILKLEESASNFESYTTSLNLHMSFLSNIHKNNNSPNRNYIDDQLVVLCKLISMHPLMCDLWIKLADILINKIEQNDDKILEISIQNLKKYLTICFFIVKELNKHGYVQRSELVYKQKLKQKNWLSEIESLLVNMKIDTNEILITNQNLENYVIEKLEDADKLDDTERLKRARDLTKFENFFLLFEII